MAAVIRHTASLLVMAWLAFSSACSPAPHSAAQPPSTAPLPTSQAAVTTGPSALPPPCQSLLTTMRTCSDNLSASGSPLAESMRGTTSDMRASMDAAPPADAASFCQTQSAAFAQLAQTYHCLPGG
jgi:hypothetical protein